MPLLMLLGPLCFAQEPLHNMGQLKVHEQGSMGFHHDLINNGSFDENLGLVGFFNENGILISGAMRPIFQDMEVLVEEGLLLEVGIGVVHHLNFVDGSLSTPRGQSDVAVDFIGDSFYSGESNETKINGYAAMTDKPRFRFPIGDTENIRPLLLEMEHDTIRAQCAYFFEDPNTPLTLGEGFDTEKRSENVLGVSTTEFWHLQGSSVGRVELLWDERSALQTWIDQLNDLIIVGWHVQEKEWHNLGATAQKGDWASGRIVSDYFPLADYPILTFGSQNEVSQPLLSNYLITLNNDGINDFLVIKAVEQSPNNLLKIFNRWGRTVYVDENYRNDFSGESNTGVVLGKSKTLPVGLYFYTIELHDLDTLHQGYLYINE